VLNFDNFAPNMQSSPAPVAVRQEVARAVGSDSAGSFAKMVAFMREERETMVSAMEKQRAKQGERYI
jgi:hypothetical protein